MTQNRRTQCRNGTVPFWNQEAAVRVCPRAFLVAMLIPQRLLNPAECFLTLPARLALPEHHKSLSTHAATGLGASIGTLAKNLHRSCLRLPIFLQPRMPPYSVSAKTDHSSYRQPARSFAPAISPLFGGWFAFRCRRGKHKPSSPLDFKPVVPLSSE